MNDKPLILVTNDDDITAKGIRSLVEVAKQFGEVVIVAPDRPQSGMGHAITVNNILRLNKFDYMNDVEAYSTSGTPVDCVKLAIYKILNRKPDLLVSGINHGGNSSTNVLYSGTMSAAVEGAIENIPSIGFSLLNHSPDADFEAAKVIARIIIKNALLRGIANNTCLNVNIPSIPLKDIKGIKVCRQGKSTWNDYFQERIDNVGNEYYWLSGSFQEDFDGEDTDVWALQNGYASVVPTQYDMTAYHAISELNHWDYAI
jgi:5'-nucleotidase